MEINDDLVANNLAIVSKEFSPIFPNNFGMHSGLTAEKYYEQLKKQVGEMKANCGSGCHGEKQPWEPQDKPDKGGDIKGEDSKEGNEMPEGISEQEADLIRHDVARAIQAGSHPRGLPRWVEQELTPTVDWQKLFARHLRAAGQVVAGCIDYTYTRPSRRSWKPFVLPRMIAHQARVGIVMDTSGSMDKQLLEEALAEVKGIARAGNMDACIYFVDTEVGSKGKAGDANLARKVTGGGGTDMGVGIAAALDERPRPDIVVVLTDGYTPWPKTKPKVPVIVGIVGITTGISNPYNQVAPPSWAKVVQIVR